MSRILSQINPNDHRTNPIDHKSLNGMSIHVPSFVAYALLGLMILSHKWVPGAALYVPDHGDVTWPVSINLAWNCLNSFDSTKNHIGLIKVVV